MSYDDGYNEAGRARQYEASMKRQAEADALELQRLSKIKTVDASDPREFLDNIEALARGRVRVAGGVRQLRAAEVAPGLVRAPDGIGFVKIDAS